MQFLGNVLRNPVHESQSRLKFYFFRHPMFCMAPPNLNFLYPVGWKRNTSWSSTVFFYSVVNLLKIPKILLGLLPLSSIARTRPFTSHSSDEIITARQKSTCMVIPVTDRFIFRFNLQRIQTLAGTSVTNHKHGLNFELTSSFHRKIKMKNRHYISLTDARSWDQNWSLSREKSLKIDWSVKMPWHKLSMRVVRFY